MLNPIAKFSLIFAYLLNLSGALILALGLADVLKIVRWRIFEQFDVLTLFVKLAAGAMVLGFIIAMIVKICSKNRLIDDYAAYLMTFGAIWAAVSFWCGIAVAIIIFLAVLPGSGNDVLSGILRLIGQVYFWGLLFSIYQLAKNVWALSGEIERPNTKKLQNKPKLIRIKNHTDD